MNKADYNLSLRMQGLAQAMDEVLEEQYGSRVGFIVIFAPFDQVPRTEVQYVSNVGRDDAIGIIRTLFQRWQHGLPNVPTHEKQ